MCFPLLAVAGPLIGAMSSIGGAVMGMAQSQQQHEQQSKQYAQNVANAEGDARTAYERLNANEMENNAQYSEKAQLNLIEGAQKQSSVTAAAATSGVAGNVVTGIINGIGTAVGMKGAELQTQWEANAQQQEAEKFQATAQETSRIGELAPPIAPNPGGAIIGALGGGLKFVAGLSGKNGFFGNSDSGGSAASVTAPTPDTSSGIGMM